MSTLSKEFYGNSYNCYRDIVAEYQRTQTNGVDMNANQKPGDQSQKTENAGETAEEVAGANANTGTNAGANAGTPANPTGTQ
jgi:hypothetical protein